MPTPYRLHHTAPADRPVPAGRTVEATDVYLTNEVFLYRVVGLIAGGMDGIVELEDCYGLDVVQVPIANLYGSRLRVVTPSTDEG